MPFSRYLFLIRLLFNCKIFNCNCHCSYYRKHFAVDASWQGQVIWVDFDGVYRASDYWLNGVYLGHHE